jgi:hypothetical protein
LKERPQYRWEDNIQMHLTEISWESAEWIYLVWDSDLWQALVTTIMNIQVPQREGD